MFSHRMVCNGELEKVEKEEFGNGYRKIAGAYSANSPAVATADGRTRKAATTSGCSAWSRTGSAVQVPRPRNRFTLRCDQVSRLDRSKNFAFCSLNIALK